MQSFSGQTGKAFFFVFFDRPRNFFDPPLSPFAKGEDTGLCPVTP
jgi:hypothetical protein